jgi:hypothetical protein
MTAALTTRGLPDGWIEVVIDCPHGTTTGLAKGERPDLFRVTVQVLVSRHQTEERCGCALRIRTEQAMS